MEKFNSKKNYPLYKIVLHKYDKTYDSNKLKLLNNKLILHKLEECHLINEKDKILYDDNYDEKINGEELTLLLFPDSFIYSNNSIIFDNLQQKILPNSTELVNINSFYPNFINDLGDLSKYDNVKVVPFSINNYDHIEEIKRKLCIHLYNLFKISISPEYIYLWCENYNIDITDDINVLFYKLCSKNIHQWRSILKLYSGDTDDEIIERIILQFENISNNIENFINNNDIKRLVYKYKRFLNLGYEYLYNNTEVFINPNPFANIELNELYSQITLKDNKHTVLHDICHVRENTIHMALLNDVYDYINENIVSIRSETYDKQSKLFYSLYFPNVNLVYDLLNKSVATNSNPFISDFKDYYEDIFKTNNILKKINQELPLTWNKINFNMIKMHLTCKIGVKEIFNLLTIFNNIELSYEIPCVRIKDAVNDVNAYKLHKPAFNTYNSKLKPIISEQEFKHWLKTDSKKGLTIFFYVGKTKINDTTKKGKIISEDDGYYTIEYLDDPNVYERFVNSNIIKENNGEIVDVFIHDDVYLSLNINNKGLIDYKFTHDINSDFYIPDILFNKTLKTFFNVFNEIDYKVSETENITYNNLNIPLKIIPNQYLYHDIKVKIPITSQNINYNNLAQLCYKLNDFILPIINYKKDSEVKVYEHSWIDGVIIDVNYDGTYNVKTKTKVINNVKTNKIKLKGDNFDNYIYLQYKKQTNFSIIGSLIYLINKSMNLGHTGIIKKIMETFSISDIEANEMYSEIISLTDINVKTKLNHAKHDIKIKIMYNDQTENQGLYYYTCIVENVTNIDYFENIMNFLGKLFKLYDIMYNDLDSLLTVDDKKHILEQEKVIDNDSKPTIDYDFFDDEVLSDDEGVIIESTYEDENISEIINEPKYFMSQKQGKTNEILNRLEFHDKQLFIWPKKSNSDRGFSSKCSKDRYPLVFTDNDKSRIDIIDNSNYNKIIKKINSINNNYNLSKENIDIINKKLNKISYGTFGYGDKINTECIFVDQLLTTKLKEKEICIAFKYGSSYDINNWYICPKIWCNVCERSIHVFEYFELIGKYPDEHCNTGFIPLINFEDANNWRLCNTCKRDITEHNYVLCPNCNHEYDNEQFIIKSKSSVYSKHDYPGLTTSPEGINVPCCFSKPNNKLVTKKSEQQQGYISKWSNKNLDFDKYSYLPQELERYFGNNDDQCRYDGKQNIVSGQTNCYIRLGSSLHDSFINCVAKIYKMETSNLIDEILKNLSLELFNKLNNGSLKIIFENKNTKKKPLQLFCEYLISDEYKHHELLIGLFSNGKLFRKENINIFVIDCTNENEPSLLCNENNVYDPNLKSALIIKSGEKYDNIVYIENGDKYNLKFLYSKDNTIIKELHIKHNECNELIPYTNTFDNLKTLINIKNIVVDGKNYIIGVINTDNIYIPIYPINNYSLIKEHPKVNIFDIDISKLATWKETITLLKKITNLTLKNILINNDKGYGFILDNESYILCNFFDDFTDIELINYEKINVDIIKLERDINIRNEIASKPLYKPLQNLYDSYLNLENILTTMRKKFNLNKERTVQNASEIISFKPTGKKLLLTKYTTGYEFNNYVIMDGLIIGFRCKNRLFIPTVNILKDEFMKNNKYNVFLKDEQYFEYISKIDELDKISDNQGITKTLELYSYLYEKSKSTLNIMPYEIITDDNLKIINLYLNNGFMLPIRGDTYIYNKTYGDIYITNHFKYIDVLTNLNNDYNTNYGLKYEDDRINVVNSLQRSNNEYKQVMYEFSKILNRDFIDIKNNIVEIIDNKAYSNSIKKDKIYSNIEYILNYIVTQKTNDQSIYTKYNTLCASNYNDQDCNKNSLCSWEPKSINPRTLFVKDVLNNDINDKIKELINIEEAETDKEEYIKKQWYNLPQNIKQIYYKKVVDNDYDVKDNLGSCKVYIENKDKILERLIEDLVRIPYKQNLIINNLLNSTIISPDYIIGNNNILIYDYELKNKPFYDLFINKTYKYFSDFKDNFVSKSFKLNTTIKSKQVSLEKFILKSNPENVTIKKTGKTFTLNIDIIDKRLIENNPRKLVLVNEQEIDKIKNIIDENN